MKHEQNIDCGGGYVKLFPSGLDQKDMHGDSEYNIMFGEGPPASADLCRLDSGCRLKPFVTRMLIFKYHGKHLNDENFCPEGTTLLVGVQYYLKTYIVHLYDIFYVLIILEMMLMTGSKNQRKI